MSLHPQDMLGALEGRCGLLPWLETDLAVPPRSQRSAFPSRRLALFHCLSLYTHVRATLFSLEQKSDPPVPQPHRTPHRSTLLPAPYPYPTHAQLRAAQGVVSPHLSLSLSLIGSLALVLRSKVVTSDIVTHLDMSLRSSGLRAKPALLGRPVLVQPRRHLAVQAPEHAVCATRSSAPSTEQSSRRSRTSACGAIPQCCRAPRV